MLGSLVRRNIELRRDEPAIIFEGRRVTHSEFGGRAFRLARAFARLGVGRGDRVAILSQNRPEYLEVYAAGELSGWITVPINYRLVEREIDFIVDDAAPKAIVVEAQFLPLLSERARRALSFVVTLDADGPDYEYETTLQAESPEPFDSGVTSRDIAYLIYTSGTTGRPKGVMLEHRAQLRAAYISAIEAGVRPTDRVAVAMPLYHIGARNTCLTRSLHGCPIVLHRAFRRDAFFASLAEQQVTETLLAPTMLSDLLENYPDARSALPSLRRVFYSAAPMPEALLRRAIDALGPIFLQIYGMTESGGPGCILHEHQHILTGPPEVVRRLRSAGQPMLGCQVRIVRPDGSDCAVGETGEILIRSGALMRGYWNNHSATAGALRNGDLHTGDLGTSDQAGYIYVVDRLKDMIVSGGENIYSLEVENALMLHPDVAEAAVVGHPDARWGEKVVAFVVMREPRSATKQVLDDFCRQVIAPFKRPKEFHFVSELPKLPSGKIEKYKLRANSDRP
jgi:acyl-CoA synthetase (AMP-forming)/AMP-acid ligase II